ncbi:hypothetical protein FAI41_04555 [Acetobacteraceae bacterium]|nr:hypothetical protein FAI41_04555 [Acetobacteraceae bacterium]
MLQNAFKTADDFKGMKRVLSGIFLICLPLFFFCFSSSAKAYSDLNAKTCQLNYKVCKDNAQLVEEWDDLLSIRTACEIAASHEIAAKTGSLPHWHAAINGGSFPSYLMGNSGPEEGKITLMDYHVQAADAYGTTAERHVKCEVDLQSRKILDVSYK